MTQTKRPDRGPFGPYLARASFPTVAPEGRLALAKVMRVRALEAHRRIRQVSNAAWFISSSGPGAYFSEVWRAAYHCTQELTLLIDSLNKILREKP